MSKAPARSTTADSMKDGGRVECLDAVSMLTSVGTCLIWSWTCYRALLIQLLDSQRHSFLSEAEPWVGDLELLFCQLHRKRTWEFQSLNFR